MMRNASMLLAVAGLLTLAACNKSKHEEPVDVENSMSEMNMEEQQPVNAPPVLEPEEPTNTVAAPAPPPPPPVTQDQQTLDDADATGLTSRLPDDYDGASTGNRAAAAQ
ncbi:MAG: hypothetical protein ABW169_07920 [Sphingobium sp.]